MASDTLGSHPSALGPEVGSLSRREDMYVLLVPRLNKCVDATLDGELVDWWILFSVNHFDMRQERVLMITQKSVLRVKVNFSTWQVQKVTRLLFSEMESITAGKMRYESGSYAEKVASEGAGNFTQVGAVVGTIALQIKMKGEPPTMMQRWNPASSHMGRLCTTLTSHASTTSPDPEEGKESVHTFRRALEAALPGPLQVQEGDIVSEASPVGLALSTTHNQVGAGEYRSRFAHEGRQLHA